MTDTVFLSGCHRAWPSVAFVWSKYMTAADGYGVDWFSTITNSLVLSGSSHQFHPTIRRLQLITSLDSVQSIDHPSTIHSSIHQSRSVSHFPSLRITESRVHLCPVFTFNFSKIIRCTEQNDTCKRKGGLCAMGVAFNITVTDSL